MALLYQLGQDLLDIQYNNKNIMVVKVGLEGVDGEAGEDADLSLLQREQPGTLTHGIYNYTII